MPCSHRETFNCHGTLRCQRCHTDSLTLTNGTRIWPSQDHPDTWDAHRIVNWFFDNRIFALNQGCEGFEFCRNNLATDNTGARRATYGYLWVDTVLDLDMDMAWLFDIRKHDQTDEWRQSLFVGSSHSTEGRFVRWHPNRYRIFDRKAHTPLPELLHWFADTVRDWQASLA